MEVDSCQISALVRYRCKQTKGNKQSGVFESLIHLYDLQFLTPWYSKHSIQVVSVTMLYLVT